MPHIPFAEIRFFDPTETRSALEIRFEDHLRRLRGFPDLGNDDSDEIGAKMNAQNGQRLTLSRDC